MFLDLKGLGLPLRVWKEICSESGGVFITPEPQEGNVMSIYFLLLCLGVAVVFAVMVMKVYYTLRLCGVTKPSAQGDVRR